MTSKTGYRVLPCLLLLTSFAAPSFATAAEPAKADALPPVEIDIPAFISGQGLSNTSEGPLWRIEAREGRRLVQVPLQLMPRGEAVTVDTDAVRVRAARFVAFRLTGDTSDRYRQFAAGVEPPRPLPDGAPMHTRDFTLTPDGQVQWRMEMNIVGGSVRPDAGDYALRLDRKRLRDQDPGRPPLVKRNPGEDPLAYRKRRDEEMQRYRERRLAYQKLSRRIINLPDRFARPMPRNAWAVFDISAYLKSVDITVDGGNAWEVTFDELELLRNACEPINEQPHPQEEPVPVKLRCGQLLRLLESNPHPYTARAVATALERSQVMPHLRRYGRVDQLSSALLKQKDEQAKRQVVRLLIGQVQNRVARGLLDEASPLEPELQLEYLQAMYTNPDVDRRDLDVKQVVGQFDAALVADDGLPVERVLDLLARISSAMQGEEREKFDTAVWRGVSIAKMDAARRERMIRHVLAGASADAFFARWLDRVLLGTDEQLLKRTLTLLSTARIGKPSEQEGEPREGEDERYEPAPRRTPSSPRYEDDEYEYEDDAYRGGYRVTTRPRTSLAAGQLVSSTKTLRGSDAEAGAAAAKAGQGTSDKAKADEGLLIPGPINIDSVSHGLFVALAHRDKSVRDLAWACLDVCQFGDRRTSEGADVRYVEFVATATALRPTPPQALPFILAQSDAGQVAIALIAMAAHGDSAASNGALEALRDGKRPLAEAMVASEPLTRMNFASKIYAREQIDAAAITQLLAGGEEMEGLARWFGQQVAAGSTPAPKQWVDAAGGESRLLEWVGSSNRRMAVGAAAALLASVGGELDGAAALQALLADAEDREKRSAIWTEKKKEVFARRIERTSGPHQLVLLVYPKPEDRRYEYEDEYEDAPYEDAPETGDASSHADAKPTEVGLGVVQLQADSRGVRLANARLTLELQAERLAIVVSKPSELSTFSSASRARIAFAKMEQAVELLPQPDGSWYGTGRTSEGHRYALKLVPVKGD